MLSRLVRRPDVKIVQPHVWKPAAGSPARLQPSQTADPPAGQRTSERVPDERALLLQARLAEVESTVDKRLKEARETAFREGETAGRNQASAEVRTVIGKLVLSIQDLAGLRPKLRDQAESDVVRLALAIAKRVVHRELNTDPDSILGLVKVALSKLRAQEAVRVRVDPAHQSIVRELLSRSGASAAHVEVTGDANVGLGGVVFETSRGEFDFSVDVQLNEIEKGLTDRLAS
jgi:flagellar assembly protein FliH